MRYENICQTGGAPGADTLFGTFASRDGHQVINFSFKEHAKKKKDPPFKILTQEELNEADPTLIKVNKILKRTFPAKSEYTNNLLRRGYWQAKGITNLYGISAFDKNHLVEGGTAWATYSAILMKVPFIYIFDQNEGVWYSWFYDHDTWASISYPSKPKGKYAGIGKRFINKEGEKAIQLLYEIT